MKYPSLKYVFMGHSAACLPFFYKYSRTPVLHLLWEKNTPCTPVLPFLKVGKWQSTPAATPPVGKMSCCWAVADFSLNGICSSRGVCIILKYRNVKGYNLWAKDHQLVLTTLYQYSV
jgi:hypothetical protein